MGESWGMIFPDSKFLTSWEPMQPDKSYASKVQWWHRQRINIPIQKEENGNAKGVTGPKQLKILLGLKAWEWSSLAQGSVLWGTGWWCLSSVLRWQPHPFSSAAGLGPAPWAAASWPTDSEEVASPARTDETTLPPGPRVGVAFPTILELPSESLFAFLEGKCIFKAESSLIPAYRIPELQQPSFILPFLVSVPVFNIFHCSTLLRTTKIWTRQLGLPQQNITEKAVYTTEIYFPTDLGSRSPRSRCQQARFSWRLSSCLTEIHFLTVSTWSLFFVYQKRQREWVSSGVSSLFL